jgi:hypothetical protein
MFLHKKRPLKIFKPCLRIFTLLLFSGNHFSCNDQITSPKIERSFYYWKSVVKLTDFELKKLDSLKVKTICLKFFDVDWDALSNQAIPVAKMQLQDNRFLRQFNIIPTIFITNECIREIDSSRTFEMAEKIDGLIKKLCLLNQIKSPTEIQIDCDWTASTANKYFALLRSIKQLSNTQLSATIRLHQVKFVAKTGIPPVDRGLLMCYNMGNLKNPATKNSIIETNELKKYIGNLSAYPLALDVAFPLFGWKVLFRNNIYKGLIENMSINVFTGTFSIKNNGRIEIIKDTLLAGYDLKKGDLLRNEESDILEVNTSAAIINQQLKNTPLRVSLYHLDSVTLKKYTTHDLESIYNSFH